MAENVYEFSECFASEKASMPKIEPVLCILKQKMNISDDRFYNLLIAVTEAFNNAIVHGNKLNPEKKVEVCIHADTQNIHIHIKDQGRGFNPEKVADPREPENLLKDNGRGVFIIKSLLDEVYYDTGDQGTTIHMRFALG